MSLEHIAVSFNELHLYHAKVSLLRSSGLNMSNSSFASRPWNSLS